MTPRTSHLIRHPLVMGVLTLIASLWSTGARADAIYSITDLGTLSGQSSSVATSINDQGQVVGISYNAADGYFGSASNPPTASPPRFQQSGNGAESFLYNGGQLSQISPTGGLAMSINNSGQVVGGPYSSVNDSGQYVGSAWSGIQNNYNTTNQLVSGGIITTLSVSPYAITNSGQIAGFDILPDTTGVHAVVLQGGQTVDLFSKVVSNPTPGVFYDSRAIAINQNGDVLINVLPAFGTMSSFLYKAATGTVIDLTTLSGGAGFVAAALNDKDQAVGNGFLYSNGSLQALTSLLPAGSGWSNLVATAINDSGQIVGQGTYSGQQVAFLMTPNANGVPEPSTVAIWCLMSAALAARARILRNGGGDLSAESLWDHGERARYRKPKTCLG